MYLYSHIYLFVHTKSTISEFGEVLNKDGFDQIGIIYYQKMFRLEITAKHAFVFVLFVIMCYAIAQRYSSNCRRESIAKYRDRLGSGYFVLFPEIWWLQQVVKREKKRDESAKSLECRHLWQVSARSSGTKNLLPKGCKRIFYHRRHSSFTLLGNITIRLEISTYSKFYFSFFVD